MNHHKSSLFLVLGALALGMGVLAASTPVAHASGVSVWWPAQNARMSKVQPFKALLEGVSVNDYDMTWQVDGGTANKMDTSWADYPHKESLVDITNWTWRGAGPYTVTFTASDRSGSKLGETSTTIYRDDIAAETVQSTQSNTNTSVTSVSQPRVSVAYPSNDASVWGALTLKASVSDMQPSDYSMYWQVDDGQRNPMETRGAYKAADIDVSGWSWKGQGPYVLTFGAQGGSRPVESSSVTIYVRNTASVPSVQTQNQTPTPVPTPTPTSNPVPTTQTILTVASPEVSKPVVGNPLSGLKFFVNSNSNAKRQADAWRTSRPTDAAQMDKIAASPEAIWLGNWNADVAGDVRAKISSAQSQGAAPVFIAYNIPNRDCGQYSAGGLSDANAYGSWIQKIASGINGSKAVVVLEPDALSLTSCLSAEQKADRLNMLSTAVSTLKNAGAVVYLDAGHPNWISADEMAASLKQAGVAKADGFALNTSNFTTTSDNVTYGSAVSSKLGGAHFVIDTARNGQGPSGSEWCNPQGRGLGVRSTANTGNSLIDAFLWLKNPGESDGNCNGGPSAGTWWPEYALGLAERSAF